jgi:hypothetical protein
VLVLVDNGGASPREVADSLGMDLEETKSLFFVLVHCGLLACQDESTTFQLTPLARVLRNDEAFSSAAFAAALNEAGCNGQG